MLVSPFLRPVCYRGGVKVQFGLLTALVVFGSFFHFAVHGAELLKAQDLDLADPLTGEVENLSHLFQSRPTSISYIQSTSLLQLPHLKVGKVDLDRTGFGMNVEI